MAASALRGDGDPAPGWGDVRQAVMIAAEVCATAAVALGLRGPHAVHAALMVRQATDVLRDISMQLRPAVLDEAVVEAERSRAAEAALAAHGLVPPRHLHSVS